MASSAQVLANRDNAKLSTGPITAEGKLAASRNSTRHGLTSKQIVLPGEDPAEYDAVRDSLIRDYAPANETERTLVEEIAAGSWRLARARRHETAILKKLIGSDADPDTAFATLFMEKPKELARLLRYVTTIERAYYRALNKLEKLQKERAVEEHKTAVESVWANMSNGFVSQKPAEPRTTTPKIADFPAARIAPEPGSTLAATC
jgi:hypothetical protein